MDHFADVFGMSKGDDWTAEQVLEHEDTYRLQSLDETVAIALGKTLLSGASASAMPVAFEVHLGGRLIFRAALPGSSAENDEIIVGKLRYVAETGHASLYGSRLHRDRLAADPAMQDTRDLSGPYGGGFPLRTLDGEVAGAAALSGLSEQDDHAMIVWAIGQLRSRTTPAG
jgi:uncharacterized protein (UPF0303 family)